MNSTSQWTVTYQFANSWCGAGSMSTAWGLKWPPGEVDWYYQDWHMFGSEHPQRVQFCFGDGAVRGIDDNIDRFAYRNMSGMGDGRLIPANQQPE